MQQLLTPQQAAKLLAISVKQLRDLSHEGLISFVNIGLGTKRPTRRYLPQDIDDFINRRHVRNSPAVGTVRREAPHSIAYPIGDIQKVLADRDAAKALERERRKTKGK